MTRSKEEWIAVIRAMTDTDAIGETGRCPTGKVWYADQQTAETALERVQMLRRDRWPDRRKGGERAVYLCPYCAGWHLTSHAQPLEEDESPRKDGESWESYAHRLEARIKRQREQLESINSHRADAGNRRERKHIERLTTALGRMTERWEMERDAKNALVRKMREHGIEPGYRMGVPPDDASSIEADPMAAQRRGL